LAERRGAIAFPPAGAKVPAGLTAREVEGAEASSRKALSNKEIAARLVISPKTAGNHIEHNPTRRSTRSSRATASLFRGPSTASFPKRSFVTAGVV